MDGGDAAPERLDRSPFSRLVGSIDVTWQPVPLFRVDVRPDVTNTMGRAHGGFITAVIDIVAGQGVKRILADERSLVTVSSNIDFLGPAEAGEQLELRVEVVHDRKQLVFASCHVAVADRPVAVASIVFSARAP